MAYAVELAPTKDGRRRFQLKAYHKGKRTYYTQYWIAERGWSDRYIRSELPKVAERFQQDVDEGRVLKKKEQREKEAAEKAAAEQAAALAAAERARLKTLRQYADDVFMPAKEIVVAENTRLSYRSNLDNNILPVLGDVLIRDITPSMIEKLLLNYRKDHAHGSAVKVYNVLNGIFKMAARDDTVSFNPMLKVERPAQKKDEKAVTEADKAYTAEELSYILQCLEKESLQWQAYVRLAADSGMRRGELGGLRWSDVDLEKGLVTIRRNLQYSKNKKMLEEPLDDDYYGVVYDNVYAVTPKGGRFRVVDIGEDTINILKRHQAEQSTKRLSGWVFTVEGQDRPMFPHSPTRFFANFGKRYGISGFHPHSLRHSSATLSLINGADVKSVADRLGHADAAVLLRVYAHATDESIRKAGQAARDALKNSTKKSNEPGKEKAVSEDG